MQTILFVIYVLAAFGLVGLILLQHGKGADMGAAFGGGASGTVFGSAGAVPFLAKVTALLAVVFFAGCIGLGYLISKEMRPASIAVAPSALPPASAPVSSANTTSATSATSEKSVSNAPNAAETSKTAKGSADITTPNAAAKVSKAKHHNTSSHGSKKTNKDS